MFYALWDTGRDDAPDLVRCAFDCWEREVGRDGFRIFDGADLARTMTALKLEEANLGVAHRSDVLRAMLLAEHGGTWVDATVLPMPGSAAMLRGWTEPSGFFAFRGPGADRLISNFVLSAQPGNPLARAMFDTLVAYHRSSRRDISDRRGQWLSLRRRAWIKRARRDPVWSVSPGGGASHPYRPYFAFHYLFAHLVATDAGAGAIWQRTPPVSALPVHLLQRTLDYNDAAVAQSLYRQILPLSDVHKLSWKKPVPDAILRDFRAGDLPETSAHRTR